VQQGRLPNITGQIINAIGESAAGVFTNNNSLVNIAPGGTWILYRGNLQFDIANVTPTGADLSPKNLSVIYWRLINRQ